MTFETDIRPLFRETDREEMLYAFDLWSHADVVEFAEAIYDRLDDGTMPCDEPWDEARLKILRDWIDTGCPA